MGEHVNGHAASGELWRHADPSSTPMWHLIERVNKKHGLNMTGYPDLYKWSVDHVSSFWEDVWDFVGIVSSKKAERVRGFVVSFLHVTRPFTFRHFIIKLGH